MLLVSNTHGGVKSELPLFSEDTPPFLPPSVSLWFSVRLLHMKALQKKRKYLWVYVQFVCEKEIGDGCSSCTTLWGNVKGGVQYVCSVFERPDKLWGTVFFEIV